MARKSSDQLFQLIESLNKNEKRNFKVFMDGMSTTENKKVIGLFDMVNKMKKYDEEEILKNPQFDKKQLPNLKGYLQEKILQSLRFYNSSRLLDIEIRQLIDISQLLFERRIFKTGKEYLKKAKRLAELHERLELLLEVIRIEKNILLDTIDSENIDSVDEMIHEIRKINSQITNINLISSLTLKLDYFFAKIGSVRNQKDYLAAEKFYHENLPNLNEEHLSFNEKIYLYNFYISYYSYIQNFELNYKYATLLLNIFINNASLQEHRAAMYLKSLNLILIAQYHLFEYSPFLDSLQRLKVCLTSPWMNKDENLKHRGLKYVHMHEINLYFMEGNFTKGITELFKTRALEEFTMHLDKHSQIIFNYKIACLHFGSGNYKLCVKWLNKIINEQDSSIREDLHCFARIINLISHYELENLEVINYLIISTYRFLLKKSDLHLFQKYILHFLRKLSKNIDHYQLLSMFKDLKMQLTSLISSQFENRAFFYFDIISWLESKIEKKPVEIIVQEKFRNRLLHTKQ